MVSKRKYEFVPMDGRLMTTRIGKASEVSYSKVVEGHVYLTNFCQWMVEQGQREMVRKQM